MKKFLPLLISGAIVASTAFAQSVVTPGSQPVKNMTNVLRKAAPEKNRVRKALAHKQKPSKSPIKRALNPGESVELSNVPFNFSEGSEASPVLITLDDDFYIPASLIGEKEYGWGGSPLYQAGGSLYVGLDDGWTGTLFSPDYFYIADYTVTVDARSESEYGDYLEINAVSYMTTLATDYLEIDDQWNTYTFKLSCLNDVITEDGVYIMLFGAYEGIYFRNLTITAAAPAIFPPKALAHSDYTGDTFTANWQAVEGATKYYLTVEIYDPEYKVFEEKLLDNVEVEGTSYVVDGIKPATIYRYYVTATDGENMSAASNFIAVEDMLPVENVAAVAKDDYSGVNVTWDAVPGAGEYIVSIYGSHTAAADETYMLADADFSGIESSGTWDEPEESPYLSDMYPQMPGWSFYLAQTIPGAVGIQQNYWYEYIYDVIATIQSSEMNITDAKNDELEITMEVASSTEAGYAAGVWVYDEETEEYSLADLQMFEEPLTTEFKEVTFTLSGVSGRCVVQIEPYGEDSYTDYNLYVKSFKAAMKLNEGATVQRCLFSQVCEDGTSAEVDVPINDSDAYFASVLPYAVDENGYLLYAGKESELVRVTEPSAVRTINTNDEPAEYYNLQGIRVANPEHGIYIVKKGNTTAKRLVR